jgi:hypothetical protein
MVRHLKAAVERLSVNIKDFEEELIRNYSNVKEKIIDQTLVTRNLSRIIELIDDSDYCMDMLKMEMQKIVDLVVFDKAAGKAIIIQTNIESNIFPMR